MSTGDDISIRCVAAWLAGCSLTMALFVVPVGDWLPLKVGPDYLQFWSAAQLLRAGQDPYDRELQRTVQGPYLLGDYPVAYMYPPWLGLLWVPLLPLGFDASKAAWLLLNLQCLLGTAALLRPCRPDWSPALFYVAVPIFPFALVALLIGQTPPLVLLLAVVAWRLLERGHDRWAGVVLAWLSIKPQLTVVLVAAILLWSLRQRRWSIPAAFTLTLGFLCLGSTLVLPDWLVLMLQARPRFWENSRVCSSWLMVLHSCGVSGLALPGLYLAAALPAVIVVLRAVWQNADMAEIIASALLASFFVAPYSQPYDFAVLVLPLFILLCARLGPREGAALLLGMTVLPYVHLVYGLPDGADSKYTLFWVPAVLGAVWIATERRRLVVVSPER